MDELQQFFIEINSLTSYLKFMITNSRDDIAFLDVSIHHLDNGKLNTGVHRKSCYRNTRLHRDSMYPYHIFSNIIKGQAIRVSRLNPLQSTYEIELKELNNRLITRKYRPKEINKGFLDT